MQNRSHASDGARCWDHKDAIIQVSLPSPISYFHFLNTGSKEREKIMQIFPFYVFWLMWEMKEGSERRWDKSNIKESRAPLLCTTYPPLNKRIIRVESSDLINRSNTKCSLPHTPYLLNIALQQDNKHGPAPIHAPQINSSWYCYCCWCWE